MSSSASEYLRRKLQSLPKTYGPSVYGDASQRTAVIRYRASNHPGPTLTASTAPSCCTSLNWHPLPCVCPQVDPTMGAMEMDSSRSGLWMV